MFYERLTQLCIEKGITLTTLIEHLGLSSGNLSRWKSGVTPKSDTLKKIADQFNVPMSYLLGEDMPLEDPLIIHRLRKITDKMDEKQQKKLMDLIKLSFEELVEEDEDV